MGILHSLGHNLQPHFVPQNDNGLHKGLAVSLVCQRVDEDFVHFECRDRQLLQVA
ncbi:hypothetical protein D3C73_1509560 [compost metagenome]